jgi:uncharacterized protein YbaR (Trm112 family)
MISQELLNILRCPMDPSNTHLTLDTNRLICQRCKVIFKIKDNIPVLVMDEAELPPGCKNLDELPCQGDRPKP